MRFPRSVNPQSRTSLPRTSSWNCSSWLIMVPSCLASNPSCREEKRASVVGQAWEGAKAAATLAQVENPHCAICSPTHIRAILLKLLYDGLQLLEVLRVLVMRGDEPGGYA